MRTFETTQCMKGRLIFHYLYRNQNSKVAEVLQDKSILIGVLDEIDKC